MVENKGNKVGYKYDSTYWTVEIAVKKRDNGSLYTVTTVKHYDADGAELPVDVPDYSSENGTAKAKVSFANSYAASGTFGGPRASATVPIVLTLSRVLWKTILPFSVPSR